MDPLTVIVTALATGATLALKAAVGEGAKDAYKALKKRVIEKYGDKGDVQDAVNKVEADPRSDARRALLKEELAKTRAAEDGELLKAAQDLLAAAQPESAQAGEQRVTVSGDRNRVTQVSQQAGDDAIQIGVARDVTLPKK